MNLASLIEKRIREAQEQGKFRRLRGEGKPQDIEENPFEDPEMRTAHRILKNAGFAPPWVELMKEIDADTAATRRVWDDYRHHRRRQMRAVHRGTALNFGELISQIDGARNRALVRLEKRWEEINKKITHLNATVPSESLRRMPIWIERKRQEFEREFPLLGGAASGR